jgi:hypothetical protein
MVDGYIGDEVMIEATESSFAWEKMAWFLALPRLLQAA